VINKLSLVSMVSALSLVGGAQGAYAQRSTSTDSFGTLRAIILPMLSCERRFDVERRKLRDEERAIYALPNRTSVDGDKEWSKATDSFNEKYREFSDRRAKQCQVVSYFSQFEKRLIAMQPKLAPHEIRTFAGGLFRNIQQNDELIADFQSGYDYQQFTPPIAPPPLKN
jgi:hypothetical protein